MFGRRFFNTPLVLQMEAQECGAASLAMILGWYGISENLDTLRERCHTGRDGVKASAVLAAAREYGLEARGLRSDIAYLRNLRHPVILFWQRRHYLVLNGVSRDGKRFYLNDPAEGERTVLTDEMERCYSGVLLEFSGRRARAAATEGENIPSRFRRLFGRFGKELAVIFWSLLLYILTLCLFPSFIKLWADNVLTGNDNWAVGTGLAFGIIILSEIAVLAVYIRFSADLQFRVIVGRCYRSMQALFRQPLMYFRHRTPSGIQGKVLAGIRLVREGFGQLMAPFSIVAALTLLITVMFLINREMTGYVLFFIILEGTVIRILWETRIRQEKIFQTRKDHYCDAVYQGLGIYRDLKLLGREDVLFDRWAEELERLSWALENIRTRNSLFQSLSAAGVALGNAAVTGIGAFRVVSGQISLGELTVFALMMLGISIVFREIIARNLKFDSLMPEETNIADLENFRDPGCFLDDRKPGVAAGTPNAENDSAGVGDPAFGAAFGQVFPVADFGNPREPFLGPNVALGLKNVSFSYQDGGFEIKDFSLSVAPGRVVAIVGASGSGKSTVARIAAGLLNPESGQVLLGSIPLTRITRETFYSHVGYTAQESQIFTGTLEENVTMFDPLVNVYDYWEALRDAGLDAEFVARGIGSATRISGSDEYLSEGQRHRLALARAFYRRTPIIILDEVTGALDAVMEQNIYRAVRRRNSGLITITHRLAPVRHADEIIVMDRGTVMERGTWDELLKAGGLFKSMAASENPEVLHG